MQPEDLFGRWYQWRKRRAARRYQQNLKDQAQKPRQETPPIRRTLTIPLKPSVNADRETGSTHNQSRSLLLSRLTFDIRHAIYGEVLGGRCFHIIRKCNRLGFLFCHATDAMSHTWTGCWGRENMDGTFNARYCPSRIPDKEPWYNGDWRIVYTTDKELLPLLLTCRVIYSEAISILYTQNLFAFHDPTTFRLFCSVIPSQRLANIRALHIELMGRWFTTSVNGQNWPQPLQDEKEWIAFWELVGQLQGLRVLEVKVTNRPPVWAYGSNSVSYLMTSTENWADVQYRLLDPLRALKRLDRFDVMLPLECGAKVNTDDPFRLQFFL